MLKAFGNRPEDRAAAIRWSAAGGLALRVLPVCRGRLAPWVGEGEYGSDRGEVFGCDPLALRLFCRSLWLRRPMPVNPRTARQSQPLSGHTLRRAVKRCVSGVVERAAWYSRELALGLLWCGLAMKRPLRVSRAEVRSTWVGSTPGWWNYRPGWAFYGLLPEGMLEYEGGVLGPALLEAASRGTQTVEGSGVVASRLYLPGVSPDSPPVLAGLACRTLTDLFVLAGCGVRTGAGLASRTAPWVNRRVEPALTAQEFRDHLARWGIAPTADDFREAHF